MASERRTVDYLLEQTAAAGDVSVRAMFGEYALYCDGKVAALICNDQLFVKLTDVGCSLAPEAELAPAYRGAKPSMLIEADLWEDSEWLSALIRATADALPAPKPKTKRKKST